MTTITATKTPASSTITRPFRRPGVWLTALVLSAAIGVLTVWLLIATSGDDANTARSPHVTNVQTVRNAGQPGAVCAPAPGTRYC